ncbi:MAG: hypothetical protein CFE22_01530 [Cytophagaceae bacterium BCCC1]|nr:MAG: hypothetical protein CFE22_01530 [Cytophagaceae bacterium BCCC1]
MKLYFNIPENLSAFYKTELNQAKKLLKEGKLQECWRHYERAHILGQRYPLQHSYVHWLMLLFGIKIKSTKEVFGQIPRLIFGGAKSFVCTVPVGNTGGANVPPLKPMEIPNDLLLILNKYS